ncbi:Uncharacterized protein OS=Sorangium cellulosum (strain So ce56) GN=sce5710 PE=4 SV=1 [Gemmata massiliana]|uniref:SMI1/KNR4 family protein n=1 Tax=Gemmata massiliana TaxID=1210884 RepID=A0A6P2CYW3_9BACT|nr:hypothetical protein [Gemmata massiliana]VTR93315.1 Uncharacterized protein OS=Sorangium cellulosum (strain So ce56) GN=sce5710 PE=4 SV=1 [Gemmata massiliana]
MTEAEWLACEESDAMIQLPAGKKSDRKLRLFAVACCDRISHLIPTEPSRHCVEVARRLADGSERPGERRAAVIAAMADEGTTSAAACVSAVSAYEAAIRTADHAAVAVAREQYPELYESGERIPEWYDVIGIESIAQCVLLREIFGNPFRPVVFSPSWRTSTAVALAAQMYESREFGALPILADALQDAGCDNADVLNHGRGEGPHVRGCWVVDSVLGKE